MMMPALTKILTPVIGTGITGTGTFSRKSGNITLGKQVLLACMLFMNTFLVQSGVAKTQEDPPLYSHDQCQRVTLIDKGQNQPIVGAEDLAIDHANNTLYVSAYDRSLVEKKASHKKTKSIPSGGLYKIEIATLLSNSKTLTQLESLVDPKSTAGGFRPHGISFDPATREISIINRTYIHHQHAWRRQPELIRFNTRDGAWNKSSAKLNCNANDIFSDGKKTWISYDHAACDWRANLENIFGLKRSGLYVSGGKKPLFDKAGFANGVIKTASGKIALAATREKLLHIFNKETSQYSYKIKLPGGPDNLSISHQGHIIAAVHPSLWRMGGHRKLGWKNAPSKIVRIDPITGDTKTLFHDATGALFSAATIGIEIKNTLILGSVTDSGLLICRNKAQ